MILITLNQQIYLKKNVIIITHYEVTYLWIIENKKIIKYNLFHTKIFNTITTIYSTKFTNNNIWSQKS